MFNALVQVFRKGGINNAVGTPNFLSDLSNLVYQSTFDDTQQGGLDNGQFLFRQPYETTLNLQANNWVIFGARGGTLASPASAGASTLALSNVPEASGGCPDVQPNDYVIISDGNNTELFQVTALAPTGKNLIPDSDMFVAATYWTTSGSMAVLTGQGPPLGPEGNAFQSIGTGGADNDAAVTAAGISLAAGTYTISGYINAKNCSGTAPAWKVTDVTGGTVYATASAVLGQSGRYQASFTLGSTTTVYVRAMANGATVTATMPVILSCPQLELAGAATAYQNSWFSVTATLGPAPGVSPSGNSNGLLPSTLSNSYATGTKVCKIVYQGYIVQRQRTSKLSNEYILVTKGFINRLNDVLCNDTIGVQDIGNAMYGILSSYVGTLPELIISSANIAQNTGFKGNASGTNQPVLSVLTDLLRQENLLAAGASTYVLYVDALRQLRHTTLPLGVTATMDIQLGTQQREELGSLDTTDQDITGVMNLVAVQGGRQINGQPMQIIVYDENSYYLLNNSWFEGVLTNSDIYDANSLANWAGQQLAILAYPRTTSKTSYMFATLRLTARDNLQLIGFTDGSTQTLYPAKITYQVDQRSGLCTSTIDLAQLKPDIISAMIEKLAERSVRAINQQRPVAPIGDAYVVSGFDATINGGQITIAAGVVRWLGVDYHVPAATFTPSQLTTFYGVNLNASGSATISQMPSVLGISQQAGLAAYKISSQGGIPARQDNYQGVVLWRVTQFAGLIAGYVDLRPVGAPQQGVGKNLIPDSDMKLGKHFWNKQYGPSIQSLAAGLNGMVYTPKVLATSIFSLGGANVAETLTAVGGVDGNMYLAGFNDGKLYKVTQSGVVSSIALTAFAAGLIFGPDGNLYCLNNNGGKLAKVNPVTMALVAGFGTAGQLTLNFSAGTGVGNAVAAGLDGNLWVVLNPGAANKLSRITTAGVETDFAVPTASAGVFACIWGPDGRIWFTEQSTNKIGAFDPTLLTFTEYALPAGMVSPSNMCVGPDGKIWFCCNNTTGSAGLAVANITTNGVFGGPYSPTPAVGHFGGYSGICVGSDGNIWFTAQQFSGALYYCTTNLAPNSEGIVQTVPNVCPQGTATGIFTGIDGRLYVASYQSVSGFSMVVAATVPQTTQQAQVAPFGVQPATAYAFSCLMDARALAAGSIFARCYGQANIWPNLIQALTPDVWWQLNEQKGAGSAADGSGNNRYGTFNGTVRLGAQGITSTGAAGVVSTAAVFDGSTGYISSVYQPASSQVFSIAAVINPGSGPAADQMIFDVSDDANNGILLKLTGAGHLTPAAEILIGGSTATATAAGALTAGTWNLVVATYDGTTLRLYVNNLAAVTASLSGVLSFPVLASACRSQSASTLFFLGTVDDITAYRYTLSAAQVSAMYAAMTASPNLYATLQQNSGQFSRLSKSFTTLPNESECVVVLSVN
jgi:virginiamycin B lyase